MSSEVNGDMGGDPTSDRGSDSTRDMTSEVGEAMGDSERQLRQHGTWSSPISASMLAGDKRLSSAQWDSDGETLVWLEGRSDRGVLVAARTGDAPRDLTRELNVRGEVGYGGGDFAVHGGYVYFAVRKEGRLYRQPIGRRRRSSDHARVRQGRLAVVSPCGRWLAYVHHDDDRVDRIAVVDIEGRCWPQILAEGHDFFMQPRWSPDGLRLAWVAWDHPNMPWDGAKLYVAEVDTGGHGPAQARRTACDRRRRRHCRLPAGVQLRRGRVYYVSDESGWGHL